jgi:hypothetical protein
VFLPNLFVSFLLIQTIEIVTFSYLFNRIRPIATITIITPPKAMTRTIGAGNSDITVVVVPGVTDTNTVQYA